MTRIHSRFLYSLLVLAVSVMMAGCDRPEPEAVEPDAARQVPAGEQLSGDDIPALPEPGFDLERYASDLKTFSANDFLIMYEMQPDNAVSIRAAFFL